MKTENIALKHRVPSVTVSVLVRARQPGVALALSYQNRKFGSDNVETGGAWDGDALEETAMRQYDIERERMGAG